MNHDDFWKIIESCKKPNDDYCEEQIWLIKENLMQLPLTDVVEFARILDDYCAQAYNNRLWAAAYLLNGGASDDGFFYFRCWVIAQGKEVFQNALAQPDSLAEVDFTVDPQAEDLLYVARAVYAARTDQEFPFQFRESFDLELAEADFEWDEDSVEAQFPRIVAKINSTASSE